jgi:hypothetical protein
MEGPQVMLRSSIRRFLLAVAVSSSALPTLQAGWPELHQEHKIDKARNNYWPQPFRSMDASAAVSPFDVMRCNGWRLFNTLNSCLFDEHGQLTEVGKLQLYRVINHSPADKRMVYVSKAATEKLTAARVESIELAISEFLPSGELPPILVSHEEQPISSGQYQTALNRALMRSVPTPRLPSIAGGGGGAAAGAAGAGN